MKTNAALDIETHQGDNVIKLEEALIQLKAGKKPPELPTVHIVFRVRTTEQDGQRRHFSVVAGVFSSEALAQGHIKEYFDKHPNDGTTSFDTEQHIIDFWTYNE